MALDADSPAGDADLLARYSAGDRAAALALTERLVPQALSVAQRLLGDRVEAEDVVQEAMLRLWTAAPGWRAGEARVSTWLYRVVVNLCTDRHRRKVPQPRDTLPDHPDGTPGQEARLQARARQAALQAALADLPDRQRQVVVLRDIEGLPNPDIAEIVGVSVQAVESLAARGRRGLKAALAGRRGELGFEDDG
ncbi:RNA polymerase subunit sigma [Meridianimarinicoccus roseus]|uniref:RNA polymerase subunit sigma n=1 Tax=Meridianimarinicoccus roseus TaxID=2072018 RepID=A0A2V2LRD0_9RHOB|nr:sigma-70 family RNA polymerase sigma factor [Meridianimarinicoccus roseus]PWR04033.1 RNA polymerase subunit sigma [Meridianimarinicoccus roseus]